MEQSLKPETQNDPCPPPQPSSHQGSVVEGLKFYLGFSVHSEYICTVKMLESDIFRLPLCNDQPFAHHRCKFLALQSKVSLVYDGKIQCVEVPTPSYREDSSI